MVEKRRYLFQMDTGTTSCRYAYRKGVSGRLYVSIEAAQESNDHVAISILRSLHLNQASMYCTSGAASTFCAGMDVISRVQPVTRDVQIRTSHRAGGAWLVGAKSLANHVSALLPTPRAVRPTEKPDH